MVKDLTVGQNITLGYEPKKGCFVDYKNLNDTVNNILQRLNCRFKAENSAAFLSAGEMQMVAIAKALFHNSNVISLDEPTASLTTKETDALFKIIRELKANRHDGYLCKPPLGGDLYQDVRPGNRYYVRDGENVSQL